MSYLGRPPAAAFVDLGVFARAQSRVREMGLPAIGRAIGQQGNRTLSRQWPQWHLYFSDFLYGTFLQQHAQLHHYITQWHTTFLPTRGRR